jgi:aerobic-type carbon monoxide dehydrogenase small subunit (CoxS/CutS family)
MSEHSVRFILNGRHVAARVGSDETVVEMLRERFDLFGARESCGQGLCGCCTVLVDGRPVSGCLTLAAFVDCAAIVTIEHLAAGDLLDPIQQAFIEAGAFQCGFCTPGFVLMTKALLDQHPEPGDDQIRHYLSGNLCRCGSYPQIVEAVKIAARKRRAN